jgi:hypothetical protein
MNYKNLVGIILAGLLINVFILYWLFFRLTTQYENLSNKQSVQAIPQEVQESTSSSGTALQNCSYTCSTKISEIENDVAFIKKNIQISNNAIPQPSEESNDTQVKEIIIPFGGGSAQAFDWIDVQGLAVTIDGSKYPEDKKVIFEATIHIPTGNGKMSVRLFNKTKQIPVWNSEIETESGAAVLKTSQPITLESGNTIYQVQLKNSLNVLSTVDQSRIKITLP